MGTGVVSALLHNFPYGSDGLGLKIAAVVFFLLNLALFVFISTCTIVRSWAFPEVGSITSSNLCVLTFSLDMATHAVASCTKFVCRLPYHGKARMLKPAC